MLLDPGRAGKLLHTNTLAVVNSQEALAQVLGLSGDTAPGLTVHAEVSLLDAPHDGVGGVKAGTRVEGSKAT